MHGIGSTPEVQLSAKRGFIQLSTKWYLLLVNSLQHKAVREGLEPHTTPKSAGKVHYQREHEGTRYSAGGQ